jgi:hypothetical protein
MRGVVRSMRTLCRRGNIMRGVFGSTRTLCQCGNQRHFAILSAHHAKQNTDALALERVCAVSVDEFVDSTGTVTFNSHMVF